MPERIFHDCLESFSRSFLRGYHVVVRKMAALGDNLSRTIRVELGNRAECYASISRRYRLLYRYIYRICCGKVGAIWVITGLSTLLTFRFDGKRQPRRALLDVSLIFYFRNNSLFASMDIAYDA